jgi:hypothetical protein
LTPLSETNEPFWSELKSIKLQMVACGSLLLGEKSKSVKKKILKPMAQENKVNISRSAFH